MGRFRQSMGMAFVLSILACVGDGSPEGGTPLVKSSWEGAAGAVMGRWEWVSFQGMDDTEILVEDPSRYTLDLRQDGVSVLADCNRGMGGFDLSGSSLGFGELGMTRMACPPESLGDRFVSYLGYVRSWVMEDGDLNLSLLADGGIMRFRRASGSL